MTNNMNQTDGAGSKRLRRAVDGRMLGGVATGLATHFGFEVTYVRLAFVVLSILGGAGIPLYLAAWALIPEDGSDVAIADRLLRPAGGAAVVNASVVQTTRPAFAIRSTCCEKGMS